MDSRNNVIAFYHPTPVRKFNVGDVHGEMHFLTSAGAGTVLHPVSALQVLIRSKLTLFLASHGYGLCDSAPVPAGLHVQPVNGALLCLSNMLPCLFLHCKKFWLETWPCTIFSGIACNENLALFISHCPTPIAVSSSPSPRFNLAHGTDHWRSSPRTMESK
jgi:hypothetical protein